MSDVLPVIKIVRPECPGGFCEINVSDFDASRDTIFKEGKNPQVKKPAETLSAPMKKKRRSR